MSIDDHRCVRGKTRWRGGQINDAKRDSQQSDKQNYGILPSYKCHESGELLGGSSKFWRGKLWRELRLIRLKHFCLPTASAGKNVRGY
jgi:hypothetical protein